MSFARYNAQQRLIVVSNFSQQLATFNLQVPANLLQQWQVPTGQVELTDLLQINTMNSKATPTYTLQYAAKAETGTVQLQLPGLASVVLSVPTAP